MLSIVGSPGSMRTMSSSHLTRYAWLSVAAAVATISIKTLAWWLTGSVGLLSDAAESVVNLIAAVVALIALKVAAKPADHDHHYGHSKAEYFSAAIEGVMIFVAAAVIMAAAFNRLWQPEPLSEVGLGLVVSLVASLFNGAVAWVLLRAAKTYRSISLEADGQHLMTDVWTSVGVMVGVTLVWATGWLWLDPVIAICVAINILWTGWKLIVSSTAGLMDASLPPEDNERILSILDSFSSEEIQFHALRTRESGSRRFMDVHMLVPGEWSVQEGHTQMDYVIEAIKAEYPDMSITPHLEPIEDPRSYKDIGL